MNIVFAFMVSFLVSALIFRHVVNKLERFDDDYENGDYNGTF